MKKLLLSGILLLTPIAAYAQATQIATSATLPMHCTVGNVYLKTGTSAGLYSCNATDTWTAAGGGGGGSISGTIAAGQVAHGVSSDTIGGLFAADGGGTYTLTNSGLVFKSAAGVEFGRIWMTDWNDATNYNTNNLYIGYNAGFGQPTNNVDAGYRNLGIGTEPLYSVTTGFDNYAIGKQSLYSLTTGSDNTAYGYFTLKSITSGQSNTAVGNSALYLTTGDNNTAFGSGACTGANPVTTGSNNICLGYNAVVPDGTASNQMALGSGTITKVYIPALNSTGSATGKKVVCVDTSTGQLYVSSTGTDCSN